ncbi:hypothetical protein PCO82_08620 [Pectobacteriaceae bacterium CE90]|nr:hypothetical protein PCO82_08620 [Pectobacteriaceae bacterium CE90]
MASLFVALFISVRLLLLNNVNANGIIVSDGHVKEKVIWSLISAYSGNSLVRLISPAVVGCRCEKRCVWDRQGG